MVDENAAGAAPGALVRTGDHSAGAVTYLLTGKV